MDYIAQVLADLGSGSQLTITYTLTDKGNHYHGLITDSTGEIVDARHYDMDIMLGTLNELAEEWLLEQPI